MKFRYALLLAGSLIASYAEAAKPTEESLKNMFVLLDVQHVMQTMNSNLDVMLKNIQENAFKSQPVSKEKQEAFDRFRDKLKVIYKQEMSWEHMEPALLEIYSNSLNQEDVDGITAFYQSPAGQAYIKKMPLLTQQSIAVMQKQMQPFMQKILIISKEMNEELAEIDKKEKNKNSEKK